MTPENQSRPQDGASQNPQGGSAPSDRDPAEARSFGSNGEGGPSGGPDHRQDYGAATANAADGTGQLTAGPKVADALKREAVAERADIAADDAGASAFAEGAQGAALERSRNATGAASPHSGGQASGGTQGSGAFADSPQGDEVDPGAG